MLGNVRKWTYVSDGLPEYGECVYAACRAKDGHRPNWVAEVPCYGARTGTFNYWGIPILDLDGYECYAWKPMTIPKPPKEKEVDRVERSLLYEQGTDETRRKTGSHKS